MTWMEKAISSIFEDHESKALHVKFDWWKPSSRKYKGNIIEQYWLPNTDDTNMDLFQLVP